MIYIHVPFCKSFCTYCGFYSVICRSDDAAFERYADLVCREIEERRDEILASGKVNTLYIGGGTPSVLPPAVLRRIVDALPAGSHGYDEFTVEANPDDVTPEFVAFLKDLGACRVSLGVQSFDDVMLRRMNRRHSATQAVRAVELLRSGGIGNISIDLIFGFPSLSDDTWASTLDTALRLHPEHVSAYQLSIEDGSVLEKRLADGLFTEASAQQCARQYEYLCRTLACAGYCHYEVSNFAVPGREAIHNSAYWSRAPYVGLGPGAHSFDGSRRRSWNGELVPGGTGYSSEYEVLTDEDIATERIMLGLRTATGIGRDELSAIIGERTVSDALRIGALKTVSRHSKEQRLRIPEEKFFVCDDIIRNLIP